MWLYYLDMLLICNLIFFMYYQNMYLSLGVSDAKFKKSSYRQRPGLRPKWRWTEGTEGGGPVLG